MKHAYQPAEYAARKAARQSVKAQHGQGQNVPAIRDRLDALEKAVGVVKP